MMETMLQIIDEPLKGPETLYEREGWIGEARGARENFKFFDVLDTELQKEIKQLEA